MFVVVFRFFADFCRNDFFRTLADFLLMLTFSTLTVTIPKSLPPLSLFLLVLILSSQACGKYLSKLASNKIIFGGNPWHWESSWCLALDRIGGDLYLGSLSS
jgi:hypothetical protein